MNKEQFTQLLNKYDAAYFHNEVPLISDEEYDKLVKEYEGLYGKYKPNSMAGLTINVVDLPSYAPSLDKIKKRKELDKYTKKFPPPHVVMDKVDGMSIILHYNANGLKIYTHSTGGYKGSDISHLADYINVPKNIKDNVEIRGELAVTMDVFAKYEQIKNEKGDIVKDGYTSPRNMVSGLVLAKNNIKYDIIKQLVYFAFEIKKELCMSDQLRLLQDMGFTVPDNTLEENITFEKLTKELKIKTNVPRDGKVLCSNVYYKDVTKGLPKHKIAFKIQSDTKQVTVTEVIWEESPKLKLKPRIKYESVVIEKGNCTGVTAYHAKFIKDNNIGPGTILLISRDIVPDIVEVIQGTIASMPKGKYKWDKTNTNIIIEMNDNVRIKRIYTFFKVLEVKYLGEKTVKKLYEGGIKTIREFLDLTVDKLCKIDGFQETGAKRIIHSLGGVYKNATLAKVMVGSCLFPNFDTKIQDILNIVPRAFNILIGDNINDLTEEEIQTVPGIKTLAQPFLDGIEPFKMFLETIPTIKEAIIKNYRNNAVTLTVEENNNDYGDIFTPPLIMPEINTNVLTGLVIVFSGDKKLTEKAKSMGAVVDKGVTKRTTLLVIEDTTSMTTKQVKCIKDGIKIMSLKEFKETYDIN